MDLKSVIILLFALFVLHTHAQLDMTGGNYDMNFEDNIAEESQDVVEEHVILPKPILNGGKPFYVARDPTTGNLDFNVKKTVGISNDIPISRKDEIVSSNSKGQHDINSIGHTFHDFLNIPVKYSSSKFVYPLISSSYSNLKYQGNNKNQVSNHKNYSSTVQTTTMSPKYFTHIVIPSTPVKHVETTTKKILTTISTTQKPTTTKAPSTTTTTTTTTTSTSTLAPSTVKYSSTIIQSNQFPTTFKKYIDSSDTRRKTTVAATPKIEVTTMPANPVKFLDDLLESIEKKETKATTYKPPNYPISFSTSMPLMKPSAFKPMPTESPADSHKITFESGSRNPAVMSLSEIFNSINGNDNFSNEYETADSVKVEVKRPLPLSTLKPISATTFASPAPPVNPQKTLQQHMQSDIRPQFIDLPVHNKPSQYQTQAPPPQYGSHVGFPSSNSDHSIFDDYVEFENPKDSQYVRYEVQKPNVNLAKFQQMPLPSMNNVVISPGQNSATFVLGSQQNVGSIGVGSSMGVGTSLIVDNGSAGGNGHVKKGQVINEEAPNRQSNIRFPNDVDNSFENAPIIKGTIKLDGSSDSFQPPQALSQNQPPAPKVQKPLVFPAGDQNVLQAELSVGMSAPSIKSQNNPSYGQNGPSSYGQNPSNVVFETANDIYEKINDKNKKQEAQVPEFSSNELPPPFMLTPPSPTQQNQFNSRPQNQQQQQYHHQQQQGPFRRQQKPSVNILPQFRPNSRISQGHPQYREVVGAIRVPQNQQFRPQALPKVGLPPINPNIQQNMNTQQNLGRMNPNIQQNLGPMNPNMQQNLNIQQNLGPMNPNMQQNKNLGPMNPNIQQNINIQQNLRRNPGPPQRLQRPYRGPYPAPGAFNEVDQSANRRVFKVPSQQDFPVADRYMKPPPVQQPPMYYLNRPLTSIVPETLQMQQRPSAVYQDVELNKSLPPSPALNITRMENDEMNGKLEPVVTLQMLQMKKGGNRLNYQPSVPQEVAQELNTILPKNHKDESQKEPSVYVVYPIQGQNTFENQQPQQIEINEKPEEILTAPSKNEYQNTPFTVVSHFEQEPLLMKKDKKKLQFPYLIEKPTPPPAEVRTDKVVTANYGTSIYNIGEEPNGPISSKLTRITEKPIAIAYTPTEPTKTVSYYQPIPHHLYPNQFESHLGKFSMPNYAGPVISEIDYLQRNQQQQQQLQQYHNNHQQAQQHQEIEYHHHYDFEAPFQASVSVNPEVITNPYEGWSIVTKSTEEVNKIDRSDINALDSNEEITTTKEFDPHEFHPIFESGFQPIYSSNRVSLAPEISLDFNEHATPLALFQTSPVSIEERSPHSTTEMTQKSSTSSSSSAEFTTAASTISSHLIVTTTAAPAEKKEKKKIEIDSLEAFFESLTRDYDDEEENASSKSENETRSL